MNILDCIEVWFNSLRAVFEASDVTSKFERTADQRINASAVFTVRRDRAEVDLIVWESGEAELTVIDSYGATRQEHFDNLTDQAKLATILSQTAEVMRLKIA
jgi:hypothetical protein